MKSQTSGLWDKILPPRDVYDFKTKNRQELLLTELDSVEIFGHLELSLDDTLLFFTYKML
jgi:hypothetical protein